MAALLAGMGCEAEEAQGEGEEEDVMNDDYNEGRRLWKRLSGTHDAVGQYSAIGALVRLVREAEDFVDSYYQECTKRGSKDERDSAAWLSEARALVEEGEGT